MSTILFNEIVFGPVHSRRMGSSLGINLLPYDGKLCSFDCIYCECGFNKDFRTKTKLPDKENVKAALLKHFGSVRQIKAAGIQQISQVQGIGAKRAKNIYDYFHKA